jgi:hypothetical protein
MFGKRRICHSTYKLTAFVFEKQFSRETILIVTQEGAGFETGIQPFAGWNSSLAGS